MDEFYRDIPEGQSLVAISYFGFLVSTINDCTKLFKHTVEKYKDIKIELLTDESLFYESINKADKKEQEEYLKHFRQKRDKLNKDIF